jgi:sortase (surface protein transpeptidase)
MVLSLAVMSFSFNNMTTQDVYAQTANDEIALPKTSETVKKSQKLFDTSSLEKVVQQRDEQARIAKIQAENAARINATRVNTKKIAQQTVTKPANYDRLVIPKIGLNAQLVTMGRVNGTPGVHNTLPAWFNESSRAGTNNGVFPATFITGHNTGIFRNLGRLAVGDAVTVGLQNGEEYTYTVRKIETRSYYEGDNLMKDVLGLNGCDGGQCLNLMTCAGSYDANIQTSSHRLIIYATR